MGARADVAEDDGGASSDRGDGKVDRESRSDENKRRVAPERVEVIPGKMNEARMTNDERSSNARITKEEVETPSSSFRFCHWRLRQLDASSFVIAMRSLITSAAQLHELVSQIESVDRVAVDTEADSLHCYRGEALSAPSQPAGTGLHCRSTRRCRSGAVEHCAGANRNCFARSGFRSAIAPPGSELYRARAFSTR